MVMSKQLAWPLLILVLGCSKPTADESSHITACTTPQLNDEEWYTSGKKAPLFQGLEGITFPVSTKSDEARKYFRQGMMLSYGYNHGEAARSFFQASKIDTNFAMAYWGFAYVLGPNYNSPMREENLEHAQTAIKKAKEKLAFASEIERALIEALEVRYQKDISKGNEDYAKAMKNVFQAFPSDPDVGALYVESLLNLHPWNLYKNKEPLPWTHEIISTLEGLIKIHPLHAGIHHFYIHTLESSPFPERALSSARLLESLVSGSGHLIHMPSHIYINTGDYHLGTLTNLKALEVDSLYTTACHAQGVYPLTYYPHNLHFLTATATLEGNSALAWNAAKKLQSKIHKPFMKLREWSTLQHYFCIPFFVGVKFSLWEDLLNQPSPDLDYPKAIWHYARGMAYLGRNDISHAEIEAQALKNYLNNEEIKKLSIWEINTCNDIVNIAHHVLQGQMALAKNDYKKGIQLLKKAVQLEDNLNYNEPPDWFFSVRHLLGAALLQNGQYASAAQVYKEDLNQWKKNGWALSGLRQALLAQGKTKEAREVEVQLEEAWQYADRKISSSFSRFPIK